MDETNELLRQILAELKGSKTSLGFQDSILFPVYINALKCPGHLWYTLRDGEQVPIAAQAFTGYLQRVERVTETRRNKETDKLHLWMSGDAGTTYRFECGWGSQTFKTLVSAIASLTPAQCKAPITIFPYLGNDSSVVFVKVYVNGDAAFAPYNEQTHWGSLWEKIQQNLQGNPGDAGANRQDMTEPEPEPEPEPEQDIVPMPTGVVDQIKLRLRRAQDLDQMIEVAQWFNEEPCLSAIAEVPAARPLILNRFRDRLAELRIEPGSLIAQTDVQMRRVGWGPVEGRNFLEQVYGKRSRQQLHDGEMLDFLAYLTLRPAAIPGLTAGREASR